MGVPVLVFPGALKPTVGVTVGAAGWPVRLVRAGPGLTGCRKVLPQQDWQGLFRSKRVRGPCRCVLATEDAFQFF